MKKIALAEKNSWTVIVCSFLGFWLIFSPFALGYETRAMVWSDMTTGVIIMIAALFARKANRCGYICLWMICLLGLWLNFAPLVYPAKLSVEYLNDTVIGILLVVFSLIIPGIPGKVEEKGHEIPPGWSYNPSAWSQRLPVIKLGIIGMFIARYLASYQLGYISSVWDPAFGGGTKEVLTSSVASFFPVSDAGLGCFAYTLEVLLGLKGGQGRWRTMPWMVVSFVFLVVPLGVVSILLVILQPLIVGDWCFLCLCTAVSMMVMIVFAVDELVAVGQFLSQSTKAGKGFWKTFFHGGDLPGTKDDTPCLLSENSLLKIAAKAFEGVSFNYTLFLSAAIGVLFMLTPYLFSVDEKMASLDHLVGALIIVTSILSFAEVIRALRFLNMVFGTILIIGSWILGNMGMFHTLFGLLTIILALRKGRIFSTYGTFQKFIK